MSETNALSGAILNRTTPEPRKGSIHLPLPCHFTVVAMKFTSFVLIPWHFKGGTMTLLICLGKKFSIIWLFVVSPIFIEFTFCRKTQLAFLKILDVIGRNWAYVCRVTAAWRFSCNSVFFLYKELNISERRLKLRCFNNLPYFRYLTFWISCVKKPNHPMLLVVWVWIEYSLSSLRVS